MTKTAFIKGTPNGAVVGFGDMVRSTGSCPTLEVAGEVEVMIVFSLRDLEAFLESHRSELEDRLVETILAQARPLRWEHFSGGPPLHIKGACARVLITAMMIQKPPKVCF